jgi:rhodanese-related sulfurtransferase
MLVNFSLGKYEAMKSNSPYFLSIQYIESESELESFITKADSFIQAVLTIKDGEKEYYYLILKDPESINLNEHVLKVNKMDESDLKSMAIQYNQEIQNVISAPNKSYFVYCSTGERREAVAAQSFSNEKEV